MGRWRRAYMDRINRSILQHIIQIGVTILCGNVKLFRAGGQKLTIIIGNRNAFDIGMPLINRYKFHSKANTNDTDLNLFFLHI